jgi:hypothetical protein
LKSIVHALAACPWAHPGRAHLERVVVADADDEALGV